MGQRLGAQAPPCLCSQLYLELTADTSQIYKIEHA